MALFSLTPLYLIIQQILGWLFAALFALTAFETINTLKRKKVGQYAIYSVTLAGKVVLARPTNMKRWRGVIASIIRRIAFSFVLVGFVVS
jgi:hypothetical protein